MVSKVWSPCLLIQSTFLQVSDNQVTDEVAAHCKIGEKQRVPDEPDEGSRITRKYTSSYLIVLHKRSVNMLSRARPRPSMLICTPCAPKGF